MQEVQRGNSVQYIVYQKVNGEVNCYAFTKSTKSTTKGFASKSDIVDYFSDLTISEPPASFLSPGLFACSIAFPTLSLAGAVIAIVLFKVNEKNLYIMIKRNKSTTIQVSKNVRELERKHEEGLITEKDYLRAKKEILLETIGNKIKFIL